MASGQCGFGDADMRKLTAEICVPGVPDIVTQIQYAQEHLGREFKAVYVAAKRFRDVRDLGAMLRENDMHLDIVHYEDPVTHKGDKYMDLFAMGEADWFVGQCYSSYTAIAIRQRTYIYERPSVFFGFTPEDWDTKNTRLVVNEKR